ncbi:MAG: hypothetical protein ACI4OU_05805 [Candidatus Enterenecus sp.]
MQYNNGYGRIDRFCAKHPRFGIPNLMKVIVFAQIAVYVIDLILCLMYRAPVGSGVFVQYLEFVPYLIYNKLQLWRLVTWIVVPSSQNVFYLLLGCYFYYWIATMLERQWGTAKFNLFYFGGALLSAVMGMLIGWLQTSQTHYYSPIDLSYYLNLSIFLVLATMFGEMQVLLFFVVPVKMKWMALLDVVLVIVNMVQYIQAGFWMLALAPLASFVNYFVFTWPFWQMRLGTVRRRTDPQVISFKKAQQKAQKAQQTQTWRHKCAVCGITDLDDPDMEFRYCSKCDGYYCYCANHINNHVHIHKD